MNDFAGDLARLRQDAARVARLQSDIDRAAPARSDGTDRSGSVLAVLGADGLPVAIQVHACWRQRIAPASFADAVTRACQSAMRRRLAEWERALGASGRREQPGEPRPGYDRAATMAEPGAPRPPDAPGRGGNAGPRDLATLTEAVIKAADAAATARSRPRQGVGANRERTLSLMLLPGGRVVCRADPHWVARQAGPALTEALGDALAAARQSLASATERDRRVAAENRDLFQEILAVMEDQARVSPQSEKGQE
jgi:hypothetical protein